MITFHSQELLVEFEGMMKSSGTFKFLLGMLENANSLFTGEVEELIKLKANGKMEVKENLKALYVTPKQCVVKDNIMVKSLEKFI